jgi:hypothetical protein
MKVVLIVLGVLVLMVAGAVGGFIYLANSTADELKPQISSLLKDKPAQAYTRIFSSELKNVISEEAFITQMGATETVMGPLVEVGSASAFSRETNNGVSTGALTVKLKFAKGETEGKFKFVKRSQWELIAFEIPYPPNLLPQPNRADLEPMARALFEKFSSGKLEDLYNGLAKEIKKSNSLEKFTSSFKPVFDKLGKIADAKLQSTREDDRKVVHLAFLIEFEKGQKGSGSAAFLWQNYRWDVVGFHLKED